MTLSRLMGSTTAVVSSQHNYSQEVLCHGKSILESTRKIQGTGTKPYKAVKLNSAIPPKAKTWRAAFQLKKKCFPQEQPWKQSLEEQRYIYV